MEIVHERICVVTLCNPTGLKTFPWGTKVEEHRLSFPLMKELNRAMDSVLGDPNIACLMVTNEGKFFSNGMDLQYLDQHIDQADMLQKQAELLLARLVCFPVPTVAAINGHFCAAGAMFGLAFDYRVMNNSRGLCFVPGVDIGLAYSPGMTELLKCKLPVHMHTEMICFAKRYTAKDLEQDRVVIKTGSSEAAVVDLALQHCLQLTEKSRFVGENYRDTLQRIKMQTFKHAHEALTEEKVHGMGFESRAWGAGGKSKL